MGEGLAKQRRVSHGDREGLTTGSGDTKSEGRHGDSAPPSVPCQDHPSRSQVAGQSDTEWLLIDSVMPGSYAWHLASLSGCVSPRFSVSNPSVPQPEGVLWPVLMLSHLSLPPSANLFWHRGLVHSSLFLELPILGTKALSLLSAEPCAECSGDEASSCGCWPRTFATGPGTPLVPACVCVHACDMLCVYVCVRCVCVYGMCLV